MWSVHSIEEMYSVSCMAEVVRPYILASLQCRDGACRAFTDQTDIACTKWSGGGMTVALIVGSDDIGLVVVMVYSHHAWS